MKQGILNFQIHPIYSFDSFITDDGGLLVETLRRMCTRQGEELQVVLCGTKHSGKTHLLQAVTSAALNASAPALYIPLREFRDFNPEILQGLDQQQLIAIDDIDAVTGNNAWEQALVELFDRWRQLGIRIVSSLQTCPKANVPFSLADLNSRLSWGTTYRLNVLAEKELQQALEVHAALRGMQLSTQVLQYLLTRRQRNIGQLVNDLDVINSASLSEKKKVSVDLIRKLVANGQL